MLFSISAELFNGYRVVLNPLRFLTLEDISHTVQEHLVHFLETNNLHVLAEKARSMHLHIHGYNTIQDIRDLQIVYVCDHCN